MAYNFFRYRPHLGRRVFIWRAFVPLVLLFGIGFNSGNAQPLSWQSGRNDLFINHQDVERHYIVHVPETYDSTQITPVVFMFHGTTGDGERFWKISGWKELSEKEGFIAVFPSSWRYFITDVGHVQTKWNSTYLHEIVRDPNELKNDVDFVNQIIDLLVATFNIDESRIYASGFSNGGAFVHSRIAPELNHRVAAIGGHGGLFRNHFDISDPVPSIISMLGEKESGLIEEHPEHQLPFSVKGILEDPLLGVFIDSSLYSLQLSKTFTVDSFDHAILFHFEKPIDQNNNNEWHFAFVKELEHVYPNKANNVWGFEAAPFYWEFFKKQALVNSTNPTNQRLLQYSCPIIIKNKIIDLSCLQEYYTVDDLYVRIIDLTGRIWQNQRLNSNEVSFNLPNGIYLLHVFQNQQIIINHKFWCAQ